MPEAPAPVPDKGLPADQSVVEDLDRLVRGAVRQLRRLLVFLIGTTVVLVGVIMFFTPGPAIVVIPVGLGILAIEFAWARLLLTRFKQKARQMGSEIREMVGRPADRESRNKDST